MLLKPRRASKQMKRIPSNQSEISYRCLFLRERSGVGMIIDRWAQFPQSSKTWARHTDAFHNHNTAILLGEGITRNKPPMSNRITGPNLPENRSRMALDFPSFRHHIQGWTEP